MKGLKSEILLTRAVAWELMAFMNSMLDGPTWVGMSYLACASICVIRSVLSADE